MKLRFFFAGLFPATMFFAFPASAQDTGRIQGKVVAEDGKPIPGATVAYSRSVRMTRTARGGYRPAPGERDLMAEATAGADGVFAIPNLPAGHYSLCARAEGFLSDCVWSPGLGTRVAAGQTSDVGEMMLERGAVVRIRVNDRLGLLTDPTRHSSPLTLGVRWGVRFTAASQASKDSDGRTFALMVPYDVPLRVWVHSRSVRLADRLGAALDSRGGSIAFTVPRGTPPAEFTLNVQGRLSP